MKKALKFTLYFFISSIACAQEYNSATYQSYTRAHQIFNKCINVNRYNLIDSLNFTIDGKWYYLGHYNIPKKREIAHLKENIIFTLMPDPIIQLSGEAVLFGDTYHKNEYISKDSLSFKDYGEKVIYKPSEVNQKSDILLLSPITLISDIQSNISSLRHIGLSKDGAEILSYVSSSKKQVSVHIHSTTFVIIKSEVLAYDNIYGDFLSTYNYQNYTVIGKFNLPTGLIIEEWGVKKKEMKYQYNNVMGGRKLFDCENYIFKKIENDIYSIALPTRQHRVFIIDFKNFLGIIEAPISNEYSNCLSKIVQQKFPNKELKYLFLTHHHPDHAGGFSFFYKNGSTIVSTEMSVAYFKELLNRKHTIQNQFAFNKENFKGKFEIINREGYSEYKTKKNSIQIFEFGKNSLHTDEFLLYYLPKQKILVISDLWRASSKKIFFSKRALNIYNFIKSKKLKIDRIYQT